MPWKITTPILPRGIWTEIAVRSILVMLFIATENASPFMRTIQPEEYYLYKFSNSKSYISSTFVYERPIYLRLLHFGFLTPGLIISSAIVTILLFFAINRNIQESVQAVLAFGLALPLVGVVTDLVKITVGRPRPDYFDRCYPGLQILNATLPCTGYPDKIEEGRKSFPSGHASMSFCSMGFMSLYLAGKLGTFNTRGRGESWRLMVSVTPLVVALMIAISRLTDYHHHWEDVTVGAILGYVITHMVYRQYYPSLSDSMSDIPYRGSQDIKIDSSITVLRSPAPQPRSSRDSAKNFPDSKFKTPKQTASVFQSISNESNSDSDSSSHVEMKEFK